MWILFSLILDLLEGKQSLSVGEFDKAQIEYISNRVIIVFVYVIWLILYAFATNIAQSWIYMFVASQDEEQREKKRKCVKIRLSR